MQFFFCASSELAHAGPETMQAVTIVAKRNVFMDGPGCRGEGALGYDQDNERDARRLTRSTPRRCPYAGGS